jgi:isopenicillin N synthase-like dioxygenase
MGLDPNFFENYHDKPENQLRLLHYPSVEREKLKGRCNAHSDFGTCTLLFQDDVGGLQLEREGEFVDVEPIKGSVVFNIGDFLMRWSNGKLNLGPFLILS